MLLLRRLRSLLLLLLLRPMLLLLLQLQLLHLQLARVMQRLNRAARGRLVLCLLHGRRLGLRLCLLLLPLLQLLGYHVAAARLTLTGSVGGDGCGGRGGGQHVGRESAGGGLEHGALTSSVARASLGLQDGLKGSHHGRHVLTAEGVDASATRPTQAGLQRWVRD